MTAGKVEIRVYPKSSFRNADGKLKASPISIHQSIMPSLTGSFVEDTTFYYIKANEITHIIGVKGLASQAKQVTKVQCVSERASLRKLLLLHRSFKYSLILFSIATLFTSYVAVLLPLAALGLFYQYRFTNKTINKLTDMKNCIPCDATVDEVSAHRAQEASLSG